MRTVWIGMLGVGCATGEVDDAYDTALPFDSDARPAGIVINELMADNVSALEVGGAFPDWIELHNTEARPVNLGGYALGDADDPDQAVALGPVTVAAGGFLVVYADDGAAVGSPSLPFALSSGGEEVTLYDPAGRRLDAVRFGDQTPDVALARRVDGDEASGWAYVALGTPGSSNAGAP